MKNKAIFLDRDGVIIEDTHYIKSLDEVKIYDFSKEAIDIFKKLGYIIIVISNQSAIARKMTTIEEVEKINKYLKDTLKFDDIFFCPHIEREKVVKENEYTINCNCRKPNTLLGEKAVKKYNINVNNSFMVGDRETDILFGKNLGVKTVFIYNDIKVNSDYTFNNLLEFAKHLERYNI